MKPLQKKHKDGGGALRDNHDPSAARALLDVWHARRAKEREEERGGAAGDRGSPLPQVKPKPPPPRKGHSRDGFESAYEYSRERNTPRPVATKSSAGSDLVETSATMEDSTGRHETTVAEPVVESSAAGSFSMMMHESVDKADFEIHRYREGIQSNRSENAAVPPQKPVPRTETAAALFSETETEASVESLSIRMESASLEATTSRATENVYLDSEGQVHRPQATQPSASSESAENDRGDSASDGSEDSDLESSLWSFHYEEANQYYDEGKWPEAEESLNIVLTRYPKVLPRSATLRKFILSMRLARVQMRQKKWDAANQTVRFVELRGPADGGAADEIEIALVQLTMARVMFQDGAGDLQATKTACKKAVKLARKAEKSVNTRLGLEEDNDPMKGGVVQNSLELMVRVLETLGENAEARAYKSLLQQIPKQQTDGGQSMHRGDVAPPTAVPTQAQSPPLPSQSMPPVIATAVAECDFPGVVTHLSFKKGDIIYVTEFTNEDWWSGFKGPEKHGLFPRIYVTPLQGYNETLAEATRTSATFTPQTGPGSPPQLPVSFPSPAEVIATAIAKYDYTGQEEDLSFKKDDIIYVTKYDNGDWWTGFKGREKHGLFPRSYVSLQTATVSPSPPSTRAETNFRDTPATSQGKITLSKPGGIQPALVDGKTEPILATATALRDYLSAPTSHAKFKKGQTVYVLEFINDEWWRGTAGGGSGLFPCAFVDVQIANRGEPYPRAGLVLDQYLVKAIAGFSGGMMPANGVSPLVKFSHGQTIRVCGVLDTKWLVGVNIDVTGEPLMGYFPRACVRRATEAEVLECVSNRSALAGNVYLPQAAGASINVQSINQPSNNPFKVAPTNAADTSVSAGNLPAQQSTSSLGLAAFGLEIRNGKLVATDKPFIHHIEYDARDDWDTRAKKALAYAVKNDKIARVKLFCEVSQTDRRVVSIITASVVTACTLGRISMLEEMLKCGIELNSPDLGPDRLILFRSAVRNNPLGCGILLALFFRHGLSPVAKNPSGETGLHVIARYSDVNLTKSLLLAGCNVNATQSPTLLTPLHMACCGLDDLGPLRRLYEDETPQGAYTAERNLEVVQELITRGANVQAVTASGYTALHMAAKSAKLSVAKSLISSGAVLNANDCGFTPLYLAICKSDKAMALLLVRSGASMWVQPMAPSGSYGAQSVYDVINQRVVKGMCTVYEAEYMWNLFVREQPSWVYPKKMY